MSSTRELTAADFTRSLKRSQRKRIMSGQLAPGVRLALVSLFAGCFACGGPEPTSRRSDEDLVARASATTKGPGQGGGGKDGPDDRRHAGHVGQGDGIDSDLGVASSAVVENGAKSRSVTRIEVEVLPDRRVRLDHGKTLSDDEFIERLSKSELLADLRGQGEELMVVLTPAGGADLDRAYELVSAIRIPGVLTATPIPDEVDR